MYFFRLLNVFMIEQSLNLIKKKNLMKKLPKGNFRATFSKKKNTEF